MECESCKSRDIVYLRSVAGVQQVQAFSSESFSVVDLFQCSKCGFVCQRERNF